MQCPYCAKEMEIGLIRAPHEVSWFPGTKKPTFARAKFHDGAVVLSRLSMINGSAVTAWLCRGCEKVVIDCAGGKCDMNG